MAYMSSPRLIELLRTIDPTGVMAVRVMAGDQLGVGLDPLRPAVILDLSEEIAAPWGQKIVKGIPDEDETLGAELPRGRYQLEIEGRSYHAKSLKELLRIGLMAFERMSPGTLDKLSQIKPRSKRIVARDRALLFGNAELSKEFAEPLGDGWWFGTNNSAQETSAWLERAATCAGISWHRECRTNVR